MKIKSIIIVGMFFFLGLNLYSGARHYHFEIDLKNIDYAEDLYLAEFSVNAKNIEIFPDNILATEISYIFAVSESSDINFEIGNTSVLKYRDFETVSKYIPSDNFEILNIGSYRGVRLKKVVIKPFSYNAVKDMVEIISMGRITLKNNLTPAIKSMPLSEYRFIDNYEQIPKLVSSRDKPKLLKSDYQLDMNIDYLKIQTESDNIYKIPFSEIKNYLPDIIGKNKSNIRLMNRGNEIPLYIKSSGSTISENDYLYFYGKHRRSDSTHYNFYGSKESYFLFYDADNQGLHYDLSDISGNYNRLNDVYSKIHYERDSIYFFFGHNTEQYPNEGWYWGEVFPDSKSKAKSQFRIKLFISPSENINNNLKIGVYYKSYFDVLYTQPTTSYYTYNLDLFVNDTKYDNHTFEGMQFDTLAATANNEKIFFGLNEIKIQANSTSPKTDNYTGIDFVEITGNIKPQAYNKRLNFKANNHNTNSLLIPNFNNSEISLADNQNMKIIFPEAIPGYNFNIGMQKNNLISLSINESFTFDSKKGLYLISLDNNLPVRTYSETGTDAINSQLNNISDNSPFIFAAFNVEALPSSLINIIRNEGAEQSSNYKSGDLYVFAGIKGVNEKIEILHSGYINTNRFIESLESDFAAAKFNLDNTNAAEIFISNISSDYELSVVGDDNLYEPTQVDYLIISHREFKDDIKRLSEHRREIEGVTYRIVDADDIYNQFDYGIKSPFAIRNYLEYVYHNYNTPIVSNVLLVGDASWDPRKNFKVSLSENFLPSYGMPVSDFWYVLVDGDDLTPDINIGRLPANNKTELNNMIDKIIAYDKIPVKSWMKEMLFLSGGIGVDEIRRFKNRIPFVNEDIFEAKPLSGKGYIISKTPGAVSGEENAGEIRAEINKGKIWTNFLGHASSEIFDMDGWQVETLNNKDRYGVLTTLSCNTGAFAEPQIRNCRNETYLKAKDKGFVAIISGTTTGSVNHQWSIFSRMVESFADSNLRMRKIGDILTYSKVRFANNADPTNVDTRYHMSILGDPLTRLRINEGKDLFIDPVEIKTYNENNSVVFSEDDALININGYVNNNGYCTEKDVIVYIIRNATEHNFTDTATINLGKICFRSEFEISLPVKQLTGEHIITIEVDPNEEINDNIRDNNYYSFSVNILTRSLISIEPDNAGIINIQEPVFRFINPFDNENGFEYKFYITDKYNSNNYLISSKSEDIEVNSNYIDWKPNLNSLSIGENYWIKAGSLYSGNQPKWLWLNFTLEEGSITNTTNWKVNTANQFEQLITKDTIMIDANQYDKLTLESDTITYSMLAHIGDYNADIPVKSWINIEAGGNVYTSGEYYIGFNLVTIPADISKGKGTYRRFDTWGNDDTYTNEFWKDSSAVRLVKYLQDSIASDEYLLLSTCRSSFRLPLLHYDKQPESAGNLDSLIEALQLYGSKLAKGFNRDADSTEKATFQLISRKGYENPIESVIYTKDSLINKGHIIRHNLSGTFHSDIIGPAKNWNNFEINGNISNNQKMSISIIGIDTLNNEINLLNENDFNTYDLSFINASEYPYIIVKTDLKLDFFEFDGLFSISKPDVTEINVNYQPVPEIALLKNYSNKDSVLIGEPLINYYSIENLSLRSSSENFNLIINGLREQSEVFENRNIIIENILPNTVYSDSLIINTEGIDKNNTITAELITNITNDIYRFNNSASRSLYRKTDNVKPHIRIKADGKYIYNNDYISAKPVIEIELYDNSFIPVTDSTKISARLNGYYHPGNATEFAFFETYEDSLLKAKLTFKPDTIEYEDILLIAYASDAENNRDTLKLSLRTSLRNSFVFDLLAVPNPFVNSTNIEFTLVMPNSVADSEITIFNSTGQKVRTLEQIVSPGLNVIKWDGNNEDNAPVPIGTYYYRVNFYGTGYLEPVHGMLVKVN